MKKWEYLILEIAASGFWGNRIDTDELTTRLNELGQEGWEVISAIDLNRHEGSTKGLMVTCKREITS